MSKKQGEIDLLKYIKPKGWKRREWNEGLRRWTCKKCGAVIEMNSKKRLRALKRKHKRECGKEQPFDNWLKGFMKEGVNDEQGQSRKF